MGHSREQLGEIPTAGELLGRTHEELVLLLIQLRRRHAATHRAIEQCCVQITSIEVLLMFFCFIFLLFIFLCFTFCHFHDEFILKLNELIFVHCYNSDHINILTS